MIETENMFETLMKVIQRKKEKEEEVMQNNFEGK